MTVVNTILSPKMKRVFRHIFHSIIALGKSYVGATVVDGKNAVHRCAHIVENEGWPENSFLNANRRDYGVMIIRKKARIL